MSAGRGQAGPGGRAGTPVVLAIGSNLGDRAATIRHAVRAIADLDGRRA